MEKSKKLGFGLMRLPKIGEDFDYEQINQMVDAFLDAGYTYFDTAWSYPGSERAIKKCLVERHPRESYTLATKLAAWIKCSTREDAINQFKKSLERTGAGYFDYYLLHNLGEGRTHFFYDFDLFDWIIDMKKEGLVKNIGFSFHSTPEELDEILTKHPEMDFVQLQINYADWEHPAIQSRGIYEVATKHGKPVVVMEPVKGGILANPPKSVQELLKAENPVASCASWALKFAADLDNVMMVLSGMSTIEQVNDNIAQMNSFTGLTDAEKETIKKAQVELDKVELIPCTVCNYCAKVCPMDIGISGTFTAINNLKTFDNMAGALRDENWLCDMHGLKRANECIKCGACEQACPQHIKIRDELEKAYATLHPEE